MSGNKMIDTILVALSTVVALGLLGVFIYTEVLYEKPLPQNDELVQELLNDIKGEERPQSYEMEKMTINLQSRTRRLRFLDTVMHFVPFEQKHLSMFEESKAGIQDIIIDTTSRMYPDELNSVAGKILLEDRLKRRINQHLGTKAIREILFVRFVVQ